MGAREDDLEVGVERGGLRDRREVEEAEQVGEEEGKESRVEESLMELQRPLVGGIGSRRLVTGAEMKGDQIIEPNVQLLLNRGSLRSVSGDMYELLKSSTTTDGFRRICIPQ